MIYSSPDFLQGYSVDEIHQRMLDVLPEEVEKTENSLLWDFTRPAAVEKAEFVEFHLNETIQLCFPQFAYGRWLDYHGEMRNVERRAANCASGTVTVEGLAGTVVPTGFLFATAANSSSISSAVVFAVLEGGELGASGRREFLVEAVEGGVGGNVASDTVKLMVTPLQGITYVSNPGGISGGTAVEDDESYRERILEAVALGSSYTGCNGDYLRWAKEVSGVGSVIVDGEWDDPELPESFHYEDYTGARRCAGAVRLILVDENGEPANEQILQEVQRHILGEDEGDVARLAPIGAKVTVVSASTYRVNVGGTLHLAEDADWDTVLREILQNLQEYWLSVALESQNSTSGLGTIYLVQVGAVIAGCSGVVDYEDLSIQGGTAPITVSLSEFPCTGEVNFVVKQ